MKLDFFNAIQAHQRWKQRLMDCVCDPCDDNLDPGLKAQDDRCDLGQWFLAVRASQSLLTADAGEQFTRLIVATGKPSRRLIWPWRANAHKLSKACWVVRMHFQRGHRHTGRVVAEAVGVRHALSGIRYPLKNGMSEPRSYVCVHLFTARPPTCS